MAYLLIPARSFFDMVDDDADDPAGEVPTMIMPSTTNPVMARRWPMVISEAQALVGGQRYRRPPG